METVRRSIPAMLMSTMELPRFNGDAQTEEGTSTLSWVPRSAQEEGQGGNFLGLKVTAVHGLQTTPTQRSALSKS